MIALPPDTRARLEALCRRAGVARLEVTGSAARDDFDPATSDLDLLVEFEASAAVSAVDFIELQAALSRCLGREVDLIELDAVENASIRGALARDRRPLYVAA